MSPNDAPTAGEVGVRPYLLTRGRTRVDRAIALESLVQTTARGREERRRLRFEEQLITRVCRDAVSLAEIAAVAHLPIGVTRVLVADLAALGLVQVHDAPVRVDDDLVIIQRLIDGVRAL